MSEHETPECEARPGEALPPLPDSAYPPGATPLAPHLVPGRASRIAALPIRGLDWLLRKAFRL